MAAIVTQPLCRQLCRQTTDEWTQAIYHLYSTLFSVSLKRLLQIQPTFALSLAIMNTLLIEIFAELVKQNHPQSVFKL